MIVLEFQNFKLYLGVLVSLSSLSFMLVGACVQYVFYYNHNEACRMCGLVF